MNGRHEERGQPTGIPQWLEQFLNSQGGMQGLLYQVGGIQGLLQLIQQQSQPGPPNPNPNAIKYGQDPTGMNARDRRIADPWGWYDYVQKAEAARPPNQTRPTVVSGWDTPPVTTNAGNSAEATNPYGVFQHGSRTGERMPFVGLNQPNAAIPTMADLQAKYPWMDNPLVAKGLNPLTPYWTAGSGQSSPRAVNPYFDIRGQEAGDLAIGGIPTAEYDAWLAAGGFHDKTGPEAIQYLPDSLKPTGTPEQITQLRNLVGQYGIALKQSPDDPFLKQQVSLANQALNYAQYGPLGKNLGPQAFGAMPKPLSDWDRPPKPMEKGDYAKQYGYGQGKGIGQGANVQQTLRAAGWDYTKGFGPQEDWGLLSTGAERPEAQQKMLNDMLYAISPHSRSPYGAGTEFPTFGAYNAFLNKDKQLPEPPDPFAGMQGAINRDAYVNDTLGGGFYGGLIPEENARNTFGNRSPGGSQDPHFPTPQLRLNPLPGQDPYDTYAGWASDQGAAFGTAPWASDSRYGHAQGFDDPRRYQQPPAPGTAFQPTPQFGQGGVNTFAGTQGWGNTSRNGQQNNGFGGTSGTQQQPMTFGASPWGNPWGMR